MKARDLLLLLLLCGIIAAVPLFLPWLKLILTVALAKGLAAMGILLLLRAGQVSFGHGLFVAVSAYSAALLTGTFVGDSVLLLLVLGTIAGAVTGVLVGFFVSRYRDIFFAMLNLALSMVFFSLLQKMYRFTGGSDGLRVPTPSLFGLGTSSREFDWLLFLLTLLIAVLAGLVVRRFLASPVGVALDGIKTSEIRLEYLGISARRVLLTAYVLSAALAGLGGAILAIVTGHVTPELSYWTRSAELVFIAILGGTGGVMGPFLGALVYEVVKSYAAAQAANVWQMILGAVLLLIILFAPTGLWGLYRDSVTRFFGRRRRGGDASHERTPT